MSLSELRESLALVLRDLSPSSLASHREALEPLGIALEVIPDPPSRHPVRIVLAGPPTAAQLRALRARFEALAHHPPASLRDHLARWPRCVVGACLPDELDAARRELEPLGVGVEPVGEYGHEAVLAVVPGPPQPEWDDAEATLEVVFLPSFHPEVVLRAWTRDGRSRAQLASVGTQVARTRLGWAPWLFGEDDEVPPERPSSEVADADLACLIGSALALPAARSAIGLDGMTVVLRARRGARVVHADAWSPTPGTHPELARLLAALRAHARRAFSMPASMARLAELDRYLDV